LSTSPRDEGWKCAASATDVQQQIHQQQADARTDEQPDQPDKRATSRDALVETKIYHCKLSNPTMQPRRMLPEPIIQ